MSRGIEGGGGGGDTQVWHYHSLYFRGSAVQLVSHLKAFASVSGDMHRLYSANTGLPGTQHSRISLSFDGQTGQAQKWGA